jgi:hypothetical protein
VADDGELLSLLLDGLNSQLQGELPIEYHLMETARKLLRIGARRDACADIPVPHDDLKSGDPPPDERRHNKEVTWADERRMRLEQWWTEFNTHAMLVIANRNIHRHQGSCLMGKQGKTGCRFNAPWGHNTDASQVTELFCDKSAIPPSEQIEYRCPGCHAGGAMNDTTMSPVEKEIKLAEEDNRRTLFYAAATPTLKPEVGDDTRILHVDLKRPLLPTLLFIKDALDLYEKDKTPENIAKLRGALLLIIKEHLDPLLSNPALRSLRDRLMKLTEEPTTQPGGKVPVITVPMTKHIISLHRHLHR